ncbi:MAG TPA: FtsX-like permease family protein, partial [Planctomycetota bacterium]|nr:FtsX-like permease family protein [Planctomycetota bacterium]
ILTAASLGVAVLLLCSLRTLLTSMRAPIQHANNQRLLVMSAVSLFVDLPLSYQERLDQLPGVTETVKWQWFGGYYQERSNWFAQFAVDPERMFDVYPECQLEPEAKARFFARRNACIVGDALARKYEWEVGDTIPIIGDLFPHPDGDAWQFELVGIYHSEVPTFDNSTFLFHWDYFEETQRAAGRTPGVGVFSLKLAPGADAERVMADAEQLFENGPMRIKCDTEAEFQRQFISMVGNLPFFIGSIGTGVLLAILLACVNTMLMAAREQTTEIGIAKALGFSDAHAFALLLGQALALCGLGGALGLAAAAALEGLMADSLATMFPGFRILPETYALGAAVALGLGLIAGIVPAWQASRLRCVEALRQTS